MKPATLCLVLAMLAACGSRTTETNYWGALASNEHSLYFVRYTKREESKGIPIPASGTPKLVEQRFEVLELDLDSAAVRPSGVKSVPAEMLARPRDMDWITFHDAGRISLRHRQEVAQHLRRVGQIQCEGDLDYDRQDSRVLYYRCLDYSAAYRFEPPYRWMKQVPTIPNAGTGLMQAGHFDYGSVLGDTRVYLRTGKNRLYVADLGDISGLVELDMFAAPADPLEIAATRDREVNPEEAENFLIAVVPELRIHETRRGGETSAVIVRTGKPNLVIRVPPEFGTSKFVERRYVAKSQLIVWLKREPLRQQTVFAIDLNSGKTMRATLPPD